MNAKKNELAVSVAGRGRTWEWIAIGWVVAYFLCFFSQSLQHSSPAISRWELWYRVPGLLLANIFGQAGESAGSWSNLPQRFDLIAVAAAIWIAAWGTGSLSLRAMRISSDLPSLDRIVFACGLGISIVSLLTLACGLAGCLSRSLLAGILVCVLLGELILQLREKQREWQEEKIRSPAPTTRAIVKGTNKQPTNDGSQRPSAYRLLGSIVVVLFLTAMLLGSLLPPIDFDCKTYHLSGPKEFFLRGRISFLPHNVYTSFPFLTEMLSLLAMVLRQDWFRGALAGQAVLMGFAPLTAVALYCAARRWLNTSTAWLAGFFYLTTPWVYRLAVIAYVEGALSCFLFLSLYAILLPLWNTTQPDAQRIENRWPFFLLAGLFAGSAMACKYPGLVSVVIPIGMTAIYRSVKQQNAVAAAESRSISPIRRGVLVAIIFTAGVILTIGPWLAKNMVETHNPVYPLAYGLFGGREWSEAANQKWHAAHSPPDYDVSDLAMHAFDVTVRSNWLNAVLFSFAPLALMVLRGRTRSVRDAASATRQLVVWLWLYALYLFATWWLLTHRLDRFWVPLLPLVAWLAAIGATWTSSAAWIIARNLLVGSATLFNLAFITTSLCGLNSFLSDLNETRIRCEYTNEDVQYVNQLLDSGKLTTDSVVLLVGQAQSFDARVPVIYNTLFDESIFCEWFAQRRSINELSSEDELRPIAEIRSTLAEHRVTHVLVNWETLLANRASYGYCEFVSPARLRDLRERGLFGDPTRFLQGLRDPQLLSDRALQELNSWGAELKDQENGRPVYIAWQVFPVLMD